ncbi:hypothetical protein O181_032625 [Austropuccinia psidii MF-1]|uniref:Integrase zinc-binding domain-containing protein n=1 Tax=Austropuccinia psidii MF-1 TaxID=1389203 RepID=A0A9Q3H8E2_9BASI|nr:hypothetical protein [Austropuccinia psidii MF-1]
MNSDKISRWELANTTENPDYVPLAEETQISILGIYITDFGTKFFEEGRESYKQEKKFHILTYLLKRDCKETALVNSLYEIWRNSYFEGIFHLFDGIIYHITRNSCFMKICIILLINTIIHELHDRIYSGHQSEEITLEKVKNCAWWPSWRKGTIEYCHTCDRFQKANRSTDKKFSLLIHIQESRYPWEVFHKDWVTELPPSGNKIYSSCIDILDRYSKTPIFLPCHKDDTAIDTALLLWNRDISHTGLFGTKLSFSTAYHPQTDGLSQRMIQNLEDLMRLFCAYEL